ncbi:MAG: SDR family oxidoreductase [Clostridia bacterium]|nr:SDR family oxidoreductase [Clostridia bacterium]
MKQHESKSVLITGAYGGMGRAAIELFKSRGYRVFALDRKVDRAEEGVVPIRTDVTDVQSIQKAFEAIAAQTDSLHAIVHFAGIYLLDSLVELDSSSYDRIFDVNVRVRT